MSRSFCNFYLGQKSELNIEQTSRIFGDLNKSPTRFWQTAFLFLILISGPLSCSPDSSHPKDGSEPALNETPMVVPPLAVSFSDQEQSLPFDSPTISSTARIEFTGTGKEQITHYKFDTRCVDKNEKQNLRGVGPVEDGILLFRLLPPAVFRPLPKQSAIWECSFRILLFETDSKKPYTSLRLTNDVKIHKAGFGFEPFDPPENDNSPLPYLHIQGLSKTRISPSHSYEKNDFLTLSCDDGEYEGLLSRFAYLGRFMSAARDKISSDDEKHSHCRFIFTPEEEGSFRPSHKISAEFIIDWTQTEDRGSGSSTGIIRKLLNPLLGIEVEPDSDEE